MITTSQIVISMKKSAFIIMASVFAMVSQAQVLNESFENWPAEGWTTDPSEGANIWTQSPENCTGYFRGPDVAFDGSYAALLNVARIPLNTPYGLISSTIDVSGMHAPELSFAYSYYRTDSDPFEIEIMAGFEKSGSMEYEKIATVKPTANSREWHKFAQVLPRDAKKVMFRASKTVGASSATLYIDAVKVADGPDVAPPTDLGAKPVANQDGTMIFTWKVPNDENSWLMKLSPNPIDPATEEADIEETVNGNPELIVENLIPGLKYHMYVQTLEDDKRSEWAEADIMVNYAPVSLPVEFNFDSGSDGFLFIQDGQTNKWTQGASATEGNGGSLYVSNDNGESYYYDCVTSYSYAYRDFVMPEEMENGAVFSFDFRGKGSSPNHCMKVYLVDDLDVYPENGKFFRGGVILGENYSMKEEWTRCKIEIPAIYAGKNVRLILLWYNNNSAGQYGNPPAAIDNIRFAKSGVLTPQKLTLLNPTVSSVNIIWQEQGTSENWQLQYKPFNASDVEIKTVDVAVRPEYTVEHLKDCTHYVFRVCAVNGDDVSGFTEWQTIATKSLDKTAPYSYDFDDLEDNMFPAGWSYTTDLEFGDVSISVNTAICHSAPNSIMLFARTSEDRLTLITPPLKDLSERNKRITFYSQFSDAGQTLIVGVMSDPDDPDTFKPIKVYRGSDYVTYNGVMYLPSNHRFILTLDSEDITPDCRYIAFRTGALLQTYVTIDDFVYEDIPAIKEPLNVRMLDTNAESARIHWDVTDQDTGWEVAYGLNDFDVSLETPEAVISTDFPGVTLPNLEAGSYYTMFVRSVMPDGTRGGWSESYFFRTYNAETELPYMENFDDSTLDGFAPFGWQVKDFESNWMLVGSDHAYSGRNCVVCQADGEIDDWIFLPCFKVDRQHDLFVSMRLRGSGTDGGTVEIKAGNSATPEAMTLAITERQDLTTSYKVVKNTISTPDSGSKFIGVHFTGPKDCTIWLDDVFVEDRGLSKIETIENDNDNSIHISLNGDLLLADFGENSTGRMTLSDMTGAVRIQRDNYLSGTGVNVHLTPGCYIVCVESGFANHVAKLIVR